MKDTDFYEHMCPHCREYWFQTARPGTEAAKNYGTAESGELITCKCGKRYEPYASIKRPKRG